MKYIVIEAATADRLAELLEPLIDPANGWKPQGGATLAVWTEPHRDGYSETCYQWAQALVTDE